MEQKDIQAQKIKISKDSLRSFIVFAVTFFAVAVILLIVSAVRIGEHPFDGVQFLLSLILGGLLLLYSFAAFKRRSLTKDDMVLLEISLVMSALFYLITGPYTVAPVWIIGGFTIAFFIDLSIGLFVSYFFLLQEYHYFGDGFKSLIIFFLLCTLICTVAYALNRLLIKNKKTGAVLDNAENKDYTENKGYNYLETFASDLSTNSVSDTKIEEAKIDLSSKEEKLRELAEIDKDDAGAKSSEVKNAKITEDFSAYTSETSPLLLEVKESKASIYNHSVKVATLSRMCAERLGYNLDFTKAIGLYQEIGKIKSGNACENSKNMLREKKYPQKLIDAVDEVSNKSNLPFTSKEAFVVAICNTITTTYVYLKKTSASITNLKIIDSAMTKYMLNGRMDNAGITLKDCGDIKSFFLEILEDWENNNK